MTHMPQLQNPFSVTRAVDFSDQQIVRHWVELPGDGGMQALAKPASQMPMIILGGRGSGKTHLIRFLATAVQLAGGRSPQEVLSEGYVGIYLRCGGINASRFEGKGQSQEAWEVVFRYYVDLVLAELCLSTVRSVLDVGDLDQGQELALAQRVQALFDSPPTPSRTTIGDLLTEITDTRRSVDLEVNNCALRRSLNVTIRTTPGALVLGIPSAIAETLPRFSDVRFVYLIDELENLKEHQQKYINSLLRENRMPCSFKVGAKLYGWRTRMTYSAGEELKEGSDYESIVLDEHFRTMPEGEYLQFAMGLCIQRLRESGVRVPESVQSRAWFQDQFEQEESSPFGPKDVEFSLDDAHGATSRSRPWREDLKRHLKMASKQQIINCGISEIDGILQTISVPTYPVIERLNIHMLYQEWGSSKKLIDVAGKIAQQAQAFIRGEKEIKYGVSLKHWKSDMLAHVYRDMQRPLSYVGLETLIRLSYGLPRHLLILLKHVYSWSVFRAENPFRGGIISLDSQRLGITDASEWFFQDARMAGPDGSRIQSAVSRIAELMRAIRYSDKPSEVSLCAFSVPTDEVRGETLEVLSMCEKWSLINSIEGGRPEKNSYRVVEKYQLNPLLAPRWGLAIARRGDIALTAADADTIVSGSREAFGELVGEKTSSMMGPRFGVKKGASSSLALFSDDEDKDDA
jgi:hypothetical protein